MTGVYAIHNKINDKFYIGQSVNIAYRWKQHKNALKNSKHENKHLQSAYNKYGSEAFEYIVLCECSKELLDITEKEIVEECYFRNTYTNQQIIFNMCMSKAKFYKIKNDSLRKIAISLGYL